MPIVLYTKMWESSGTGLFAQELVGGMLDAGADVVFVAPPAEEPRFDAPRPGLVRFTPPRELKQGGRLARIAASLRRVGGAAWGLLRARRWARVFVVTIPDPLVFAAPLLALLRLSGARIIYVVHDPVPHAWHLGARWRWIERLGYRAVYRLASALVVLSAPGRDALRAAWGLRDRPIAVIEHGVFTLPDTPPAPGAGRVLVFGTLRRNKGIREAIEGVVAARARGVPVRLLIAGAPDPIEPDYWAACAAIAAAHPDAIELDIGFVAQDRLSALIARCDAFLLPYRDFHSQSGVAMLAASNARALIAARAGGIGALIAEGMAAMPIEAPVGAPQVAEALAAFFATPLAAWEARARAYQTRMLESRAWPVIGEHYAALARSLARGSARLPATANEGGR